MWLNSTKIPVDNPNDTVEHLEPFIYEFLFMIPGYITLYNISILYLTLLSFMSIT